MGFPGFKWRKLYDITQPRGVSLPRDYCNIKTVIALADSFRYLSIGQADFANQMVLVNSVDINHTILLPTSFRTFKLYFVAKCYSSSDSTVI